jgi:putative ABC transport system ATP-binding protein
VTAPERATPAPARAIGDPVASQPSQPDVSSAASPAPRRAQLEVEKVSKTFGEGTANEVRALRDVSLGVDDGSFVVVIGMNGSGKSTLLNAVAGSFLADSGRVRIAGRDVTRWPEHRRAKLVGRVFQNPFSGTAPDLSIAENLALAARRGRRRGLGWALSPARRAELADRVRGLGMGLEDRLDNPIGSLSGGQRQALTLLMATWLRPELLLLDEHTAALDPKSADQVIRLSCSAIEEGRLTTMMVTHSMQQAAALGDRLIMMVQGRILHDFAGAEKRRLRPEDLLDRFEQVRRGERLDEAAAEMLRRSYV